MKVPMLALLLALSIVAAASADEASDKAVRIGQCRFAHQPPPKPKWKAGFEYCEEFESRADAVSHALSVCQNHRNKKTGAWDAGFENCADVEAAWQKIADETKPERDRAEQDAIAKALKGTKP